MDLSFDSSWTANFRSASQIARVLTESWVANNMFCPRCGNLQIEHFENNRPVADFFCPVCSNEYELKSKKGTLGQKVADGAYETMIERITSNRNPDFFFMSYSGSDLRVTDFLFIPKHFFVPAVIEKRSPLAETACRAGWVGCNILLNKIPEQGRISIISNGVVSSIDSIVSKVQRSDRLQVTNVESRGWIMDILSCVNSFSDNEFTLSEMYEFEEILSSKHPDNKNVKPKIRQQLQILRDRGFVEFLGNGKYKRILI